MNDASLAVRTLHITCCPQIVRLLLDAGADPLFAAKTGDMAAKFAANDSVKAVLESAAAKAAAKKAAKDAERSEKTTKKRSDGEHRAQEAAQKPDDFDAEEPLAAKKPRPEADG
jgi:hypothetical protein